MKNFYFFGGVIPGSVERDPGYATWYKLRDAMFFSLWELVYQRFKLSACSRIQHLIAGKPAPTIERNKKAPHGGAFL
jgi:hypothetical protein